MGPSWTEMHVPLILQAGSQKHSEALTALFLAIFTISDISILRDRIQTHAMVFYQAV